MMMMKLLLFSLAIDEVQDNNSPWCGVEMIQRRNCQECRSFDNRFGEFFYGHNFKKKNLTMNHQMALPGLSWCILILVVLISKCYTSGMFLLLLFCFRTLMKLCLRAVNEAIID